MQHVKKVLLVSILVVSFLLSTNGFSKALEVGEKAPDFELDSSKGGRLHDNEWASRFWRRHWLVDSKTNC